MEEVNVKAKDAIKLLSDDLLSEARKTELHGLYSLYRRDCLEQHQRLETLLIDMTAYPYN